MSNAANEWHRKPPKFDGPCPVCGCPDKSTGLHRATTDDEGVDALWIKRWVSKSNGKVKFRSIGSRDPNHQPRLRKRGRPPSGVSDRVLLGISRATAALAAGATRDEAAKACQANRRAMEDWKRKYPQLWQRGLDAAMEKVVKVVRAAAGSDAVLDDPDSYLRKAMACERWCRSAGKALFDHGDAPTLASFFNSYYKPNCLADVRHRTLKTYEEIVRGWVLFTGDPPLAEITTEVLAKFRESQLALRGVKVGTKASPNTVRRKLMHVQWILDKAGLAGRRNRDAAGILEAVPWVRPPRPRYRMPRIVSEEHISQVYEAAVCMEAPRIAGVKPPWWWKALIVTTFNTGLRIGELLSLRMADVDWRGRCVTVPGEVTKNGLPHVQPLNEAVLEHLQKIRGGREFVFEWPHVRCHLFRAFHRLQTAAGLERRDHFGFHDLRRTCGTILWTDSPQAAQLALGHASSRTTARHYVQSRDIVARALDRIPQPAAFTLPTTSADRLKGDLQVPARAG